MKIDELGTLAPLQFSRDSTKLLSLLTSNDHETYLDEQRDTLGPAIAQKTEIVRSQPQSSSRCNLSLHRLLIRYPPTGGSVIRWHRASVEVEMTNSSHPPLA